MSSDDAGAAPETPLTDARPAPPASAPVEPTPEPDSAEPASESSGLVARRVEEEERADAAAPAAAAEDAAAEAADATAAAAAAETVRIASAVAEEKAKQLNWRRLEEEAGPKNVTLVPFSSTRHSSR